MKNCEITGSEIVSLDESDVAVAFYRCLLSCHLMCTLEIAGERTSLKEAPQYHLKDTFELVS